VETALFRHSVLPEPTAGEYLRFQRALLLRCLDHPDLAPLREETAFRALRAEAEAIGRE